MLEGRSTAGGWAIVAVAVGALLVFTLLLFVRGSGGAPIALSGGARSPAPSGASGGSSASPSGSALTAVASTKPGASRAAASPKPSGSAGPSGAVAGATSDPTAAPTKTPRPTKAPTPQPTDSPTPKPITPSGYRLPTSPQAATVDLEDGQGGCPNFPTGGVSVQTSFTVYGSGQLAAKSPADRPLSGHVKADGTFSLTGANPTERWVGTLTSTGGSGSYFIVSNGCTEGYKTTITFG